MAPSHLSNGSTEPRTQEAAAAAAAARDLAATQLEDTQLDAPTQGESLEATCPEPKRHKTDDSQDPFVGGGKSTASSGAAARNMHGGNGGRSCISSNWTKDARAMRQALGMSERSGSVGRVPDMPQDAAIDRAEEAVAVRRRLKGKSAAPSNLSGSIAAFRKTRGLSDGQGSAGRVPDLPVDTVTATSTDCPCAWRPPLLVNRSVRQARVRAHWRVCQGRLPPIQDVGTRSALLCQRLANVRGDILHRRRDRAQARFEEWKAGLPPAAAAAACTPYLDVSFRGAHGQTMHKCTECGNERTLGRFRVTPCDTLVHGVW